MKYSLILLTIITFVTGILFAGTYSGGSGTSGDPYQIANLTDLQELQNTSTDWGADFIQMADIDASATSGWAPNGSDGFFGFSPIGNDTNKFTGSYDGLDHTIDALYINRPTTNYIGLFGYTSYGATIENIGMTNVDIIGGDYYVGGLVGFNNYSSCFNCNFWRHVNFMFHFF